MSKFSMKGQETDNVVFEAYIDSYGDFIVLANGIKIIEIYDTGNYRTCPISLDEKGRLGGLEFERVGDLYKLKKV